MRFAALSLCVLLTGCYPFVYHSRKNAPDHNEVAVDWGHPHSSLKWGTWWGVGYTWEPVGCVYADGSTHVVAGTDANDLCKHYFALCEQGVGRVVLQPEPYSIPLAVVTLGIVYPARITAYCSTESGPASPLGPDALSATATPAGPP